MRRLNRERWMPRTRDELPRQNAEQHREVEHGLRISLLCGAQIPRVRLDEICLHTRAQIVHATETVLRHREALVGGFAVELESFGKIRRHTEAVFVKAAEIVLRGGIA